MPRDPHTNSTTRHEPIARGWRVVSPNGRLLAAHVDGEPLVRVVRLPGLEGAANPICLAPVWTMSFSPNAAELAIGTRSGPRF